MMKNSTIENLLLLLLICVIPRKSFGATIVTSSVAASVNSGISLLKDMMENIQSMDTATSARLGGITMHLDEVRALPYNISHIKQEVLENLYGTQARLARIQDTLKGLATEIKSGCEDLIMIYDNNSDDNSVGLLHYFAGKIVKLGSAVEKTLKHADSLITETLQEVFPKNTQVLKLYEGEIERIKNDITTELEEIETIKNSSRRKKRSTSAGIIGMTTTVTVTVATGTADAAATTEPTTASITYKDNITYTEHPLAPNGQSAPVATPCSNTTDASACDAYKGNITNTKQEIARLNATIAELNANVTIALQNAEAEIAHANAAIETADKEFAEAKNRSEVAAAKLDEVSMANAAAEDARTKAANANAYARAKDELNLANQNLKIMHTLKDKLSGLVVANKQLSSYVKNDISLIDDWKTELQTTLREHKDRITPEDIEWNIGIIKNLKVLIKTCDKYLIQV